MNQRKLLQKEQCQRLAGCAPPPVSPLALRVEASSFKVAAGLPSFSECREICQREAGLPRTHSSTHRLSWPATTTGKH